MRHVCGNSSCSDDPAMHRRQAGTRRMSCGHKKRPGDHPGPSIGGGGGNRTRVRRRSAPGATCLAHRLDLVRRQHGVRSAPLDQPLGSSPGRKAPASGDPVMMTLHPRAQAQAGSGLGLKRPERRRRRSRLVFCHRINEEDDALGMLPATSRPPSKPGRPRGRHDGGGRRRGNQAGRGGPGTSGAIDAIPTQASP